LAGCAQSSWRLGCSLVALLAAGSAAGQAPEEQAAPPGLPTVTAALELVAPEGCGSEADLSRSITRRSDRIRIDPTSDRRLRIAIRTDGALTRVDLSLTQPTGRRSTRTLKASSCDEALEAAALVAAVSLDPAASAALEPPEEEKPPEPKSPPPVAKPPPVKKPRPPPPEPRGPRYSLGAAALGEAHWSPAPEAMLGPALVAYGGYEIISVLAPALRVKGSVAFWARQVSSDDPGIVRFRLSTITGELCPVRLGVPRAALQPCGFLMGGRIWAAGRRFPIGHELDRPWVSGGASLVGSFRPVSPIETQASVQVGGNHHRYWSVLTGPSQYIHRVGKVYRSLSVGVGATFP
jgi:hypothetical protein